MRTPCEPLERVSSVERITDIATQQPDPDGQPYSRARFRRTNRRRPTRPLQRQPPTAGPTSSAMEVRSARRRDDPSEDHAARPPSTFGEDFWKSGPEY